MNATSLTNEVKRQIKNFNDVFFKAVVDILYDCSIKISAVVMDYPIAGFHLRRKKGENPCISIEK